MISIKVGARLKASWGTNRLAKAVDGDEDALADLPKIVDDAARNASSLLKIVQGSDRISVRPWR